MSNFKPNIVRSGYLMHSSLLFDSHQSRTLPEEDDKQSQLSPFFTKATHSEVGEVDHQQYMNITKAYENRIKHLQSGFQRSKMQFENSLKDIYKEKIILLNIISHNQTFIDEFRNKLRLSNESTFKEIETKYSIVKSGLFHSQLCPDCILNISKTNFQGRTPDKQKGGVRNPESTIKKNQHRKSKIVLQYNWMYLPQEESTIVAKLKVQNMKLKATLEEFMQENARKLHECNRQIDLLRNQTMKAMAVSVKIPMTTVEGDQKTTRYKQKIRQLQQKVSEGNVNRERSERLARELNTRIIECELQKMNMKYKNRYI